jgi:hypothetical protein
MQESLSTTKSVRGLVPGDHPLRAVRDSSKAALKSMDGAIDAMR